ncbi:hypothetical protein BD289DRAFT_424945 [Coniella lustricola]|uniref:Uncharacterized protein n=1 Tax=Coniella lustricola TaxID=2025994 RepID=A0A2T3AI40_9PEZI|nr:hypothetical protein BD289DRAFT_424945 [Coniella lustricola]
MSRVWISMLPFVFQVKVARERGCRGQEFSRSPQKEAAKDGKFESALRPAKIVETDTYVKSSCGVAGSLHSPSPDLACLFQPPTGDGCGLD